MVVIQERHCPACGGETEVFLRDGRPAAEPVCDLCGAALAAQTASPEAPGPL